MNRLLLCAAMLFCATLAGHAQTCYRPGQISVANEMCLSNGCKTVDLQITVQPAGQARPWVYEFRTAPAQGGQPTSVVVNSDSVPYGWCDNCAWMHGAYKKGKTYTISVVNRTCPDSLLSRTRTYTVSALRYDPESQQVVDESDDLRSLTYYNVLGRRVFFLDREPPGVYFAKAYNWDDGGTEVMSFSKRE